MLFYIHTDLKISSLLINIVQTNTLVFIPQLVLPPPFSIFISKLQEYRFIFLLRFPSPSSSMFFFLYLHLYAFFISVFCFLTPCSLFLLKLRFLCQKASIFISKLHVHRFVFLLSLSKLKFFCVPELSRSWFPPFSFFF